MKIVFITPGFEGNYYCQNCIRDIELVKAFQKSDHTPIIAPVYLPSYLNNLNNENTPIFYGALNVYLKDKFTFYNYLPNFLKKGFNSKYLLRWISQNSNSTHPKGLEEMTLSVMKGREGRYQQELDQLVEWLKLENPDVVHLSTALLIGLGAEIKKQLKVKVFCSLQDEHQWINEMSLSYQSRIWEVISNGSSQIDAYISVSNYYRQYISSKTSIPHDSIEVQHLGISHENYNHNEPNLSPFTIGYLSRMTQKFGFDILLDAFILLKKKNLIPDLKLRVSGGIGKEDRKFIREQKKKLKKARILQDVEWVPFMFKENRQSFFDGLSILSVPAPKGEAFGLYILESLASGIPVLMPKVGAYEEIINATQGGITFFPVTPLKIVEKIETLFNDSNKLKELSLLGLKNVKNNYNINEQAKNLALIYNKYM